MRVCPQVLFAIGDTIGQGSSRKKGEGWDWPRECGTAPTHHHRHSPCASVFIRCSHRRQLTHSRTHDGHAVRAAGLTRAVVYGGIIYCLPAHLHYQVMTPMMVFLQRKTGISPRFVPLMKTCTELFGAQSRAATG